MGNHKKLRGFSPPAECHHHGRARSTRQGAITLRKATLPQAGEVFHGERITADWRMKPLPPARIWIAVVTPSRMTRKQAKAAWRGVWAKLNPARQVAAKQWIDHVRWQRLQRAGKVALGEPKSQHMREYDRLQPAWWNGGELTRTAAPVWIPFHWQQELIDEARITGETTARRRYLPLAEYHAVGFLR